MIKFIPANTNTGGTRDINTIKNQELANQLTNMFGDKKCPKNPNHESVCYVDTSNGLENYLKIEPCCDAMKEFLTHLSQNEIEIPPEQ